MKLLHLSDTHLEKGDQNGNLKRLKKIIDALPGLNINTQEYILIHTGDLIKTGDDDNRALGLEFLNDIRDRFRDVFIVPGNHDGGNSALIVPDQHRAFLSEYHDFIFAEEQAKFPCIRFLNDDYAFISLDSNARELGFFDKWFAEGEIGRPQLEALQDLLQHPSISSKKVVLCLHHHPFRFPFRFSSNTWKKRWWHALLIRGTNSFRRLKDADQLLRIIQGKVTLLLFGHKHEGLDCSFISRKYDIPMALDAGSSTDTDNLDPDNKYMFFKTVDLETLTSTTHRVTKD